MSVLKIFGLFVVYMIFSFTPFGHKIILDLHSNDASNFLYCQTHVLAKKVNLQSKSWFQMKMLFEKCDDKSVIFDD